jgi:hypothetical protein
MQQARSLKGCLALALSSPNYAGTPTITSAL